MGTELTRQHKRIITRHALFIYARDSFRLFSNIYLFDQSDGDLAVIATYNIVFLATHLVTFYLFAPWLQKGKGTIILFSSFIGLAATTGAVLALGDNTVDYYIAVALAFGVFNGQYWLILHSESLTSTTEQQRASFFSYRQGFQLAAMFLTPSLGWIAFQLSDSQEVAYQIIFFTAIAALGITMFFANVEIESKETLQLRFTAKTLVRTPGFFSLATFTTITLGVSRGALNTLVPFLLVDLLDGESGFAAVETIVQLFAIAMSFVFARYKRNTQHISTMGYLTFALFAIAYLALFFGSSLVTYSIYLALRVVGSTTLNISWNTVTNDFSSQNSYVSQQSIEFILIREIFTMSGFIISFSLLYFLDTLTLAALQPLLTVFLIGTAIAAFAFRNLLKSLAVAKEPTP